MYTDRGLSHADKQKILERDCFICAYCDGIATEVDHVVPWSYSRCNDEFNLVASCHDCNAMVSNFVFPSFTEKRMYIRRKRQGKKWRLRILNNISVCIDCRLPYNPGRLGATNFLCVDCAKIEYCEG